MTEELKIWLLTPAEREAYEREIAPTISECARALDLFGDDELDRMQKETAAWFELNRKEPEQNATRFVWLAAAALIGGTMLVVMIGAVWIASPL